MKYQPPDIEKLKNKMMAVKIAPKEVAGEEEVDPSNGLKTVLLKKKLKILAIPMEEKTEDAEEYTVPDDTSASEQARIISEQGRIAREKKIREMIEKM